MNKILKWRTTAFILLFVLLGTGQIFSQDSLEGDTIYQIMTDRFYDGNPGNNATGDAFKYECTSERNMHYMKGGDWQGIIDKMSYIKDLGFSAIWISPIADPQMWRLPPHGGSSDDQFPAAYHGYNAHDPNRANRFFGFEDPETSKAKLKELVDTAHDAGIKVIIDVVPNHIGDFMLEELGWRYGTSGDFGYLHADTQFRPVSPWDNLNNYHRTGNADFGYAASLGNLDDRIAYLENHDLGNLDDIEYDNSTAKETMFTSISNWFTYLGADGARVDAAKSMYPSTTGELEDRLGVPTFGENFDGDPAYIAKYIGEGKESGMLDFPLFFAIVRSFGWCNSFSDDDSVARIIEQDWRYGDNINQMVTFIDNHDRDRFQKHTMGDARKLRNALAFLYMARGIPSVFYGTETENSNYNGQEMSGGIKDSWNRWPMVEYDANGQLVEDNFISQTPTKTLLKKLNSLKKSYRALQVGTQREMWVDSGVFAFSRRVDSGIGTGEEVIAVFTNTEVTQTRSIPLRVESSIQAGDVLVNIFNPSESVTVSYDRKIPVTLNPQGYKAFVNIIDVAPPTIPQNLQPDIIGGRSVTIKWDASTDNIGVTGYDIYRDGVGVGSSTSTTFTDSSLLPNTLYNYQVLAKDAAGNLSVLSVIRSVTTSNIVEYELTVYYSTNWVNCNIHYITPNGEWTIPPGISMSNSTQHPGYKTITTTIADTGTTSACFNNGNIWDNNNGSDYKLQEGTWTISNGVITQGEPQPVQDVTVNFEVRQAYTGWGENIFITGSIPELGDWNPVIAIGPGDTSAYPTWNFTQILPSNTTFNFKAIKKDSNGNVYWQSGTDNTHTTGNSGVENIIIYW